MDNSIKKNNSIMKKEYNGLDLLKFVMALMVVMIHVKPNGHSKFLTEVFTPFLSIAVPMFFMISSVLLFSKLNGGGYAAVLKYIKRIGILYLAWLIIDGWFIFARKPYFDLHFGQGILEFVKDLILGTTFPGSWYLSASVMGVIIVYSVSRVINKYVVFMITLLISIYVNYANLLPEALQIPYNWFATNLREEVRLSFPSQMVWISLGQILSFGLVKIENNKRIMLPLSAGLFVVSFAAFYFSPLFLFKIALVLALFTFCLLVHLPQSEVYKRLRNYSILMFFFHFSIAGKMGLFCSYIGDTLATNWLYYILVVIASIVFSETVLHLEKNKFLKFLRYIH